MKTCSIFCRGCGKCKPGEVFDDGIVIIRPEPKKDKKAKKPRK